MCVFTWAEENKAGKRVVKTKSFSSEEEFDKHVMNKDNFIEVVWGR